MKLFLFLVFSLAFAAGCCGQCLECQQFSRSSTVTTAASSTPATIYVQETRTVARPTVEYVEETVDVAYIRVDYVRPQAAQIQVRPLIGWNPACAIQAGDELLACLEAGDGSWRSRFRCTLRAGLSYLQCSGGLTARQMSGGRVGFFKRLRAGRQVRRMARQRQLAAASCW